MKRWGRNGAKSIPEGVTGPVDSPSGDKDEVSKEGREEIWLDRWGNDGTPARRFTDRDPCSWEDEKRAREIGVRLEAGRPGCSRMVGAGGK
jgi:hypothetical protein